MERSVTGIKYDILEALKRQEMMTIDGLVEHFELSKTALRAHLLYLEKETMIERVKIPTEGPGRPPLGYRVSDRGGEVFSTADSALLTRLLEFLGRQGAGELIDGFFEELWSERREDFRAALGAEDLDMIRLEDKLSLLQKLLSAHNFMPAIKSQIGEGGGVKICIRECNCPFPAAVRATEIPCQKETKFLEEVLGARLVRASFASKRSEVCRFDLVVGAGDGL